jgi:hypothetical protein
MSRVPRFSVQEWELLSFFEAEPELAHDDEHWYCNNALYRLERSGVELAVTVTPFAGDAQIKLVCRGETCYEFVGLGILDLRYVNDEGREFLTFVLTDKESINVSVKPRIEIKHHIKIY